MGLLSQDQGSWGSSVRWLQLKLHLVFFAVRCLVKLWAQRGFVSKGTAPSFSIRKCLQDGTPEHQAPNLPSPGAGWPLGSALDVTWC